MSEVSEPKLLTRKNLLDQIKGEVARPAMVDHFAMYASQRAIARFLMRYELFKKIVDVHGSIIECGVGWGSGLLAWHQLSKMLEPYNRSRMIYGFDTFEGFPSIHENDSRGIKPGDLNHGFYPHIYDSIRLLDRDKKIFDYAGMDFDSTGQTPWTVGESVQIVIGDFLKTGPEFMEKVKHLVIACLFLDFDLYEPTKKAIELFLPRMPKGAIIAFDELDEHEWPGETLAVLEGIGLGALRLRRFPWERTTSYAIIGE